MGDRLTWRLLNASLLLVSGCGGTDSTATVYSYTIHDGSVLVHPHRVHVTVAGPTDPTARVHAAVEALMSFTPPDDEHNLWSDPVCAPSDSVHQVTVTDTRTTVNIDESDANAICDLSAEGLTAQQQQIAWTVRAAVRTDAPVMVTQGKDRYRIFGHHVTAAEKYRVH